MKFFEGLERKLGRYAIKGLPRIIVLLYGLGMVIHLINPAFYYLFFSLEGGALLHGQIWRIITFMMYPPVTRGGDPISWILLNMLIIPTYYFLSNTLETIWGAFRFNVYFLLGILGHVAGAVFAYLIWGVSIPMTPIYLNFSLFIAVALMFPEVQFFIFGVLPVKAKYLALAETVIYLYEFIRGPMITKLEVGLSLINVLLFFAITRNVKKFSPKEIKRKREFKAQVKMMPAGRTRHRCAVCGRTEEDGAQMEFRYCSKCAGSYEYCQDHLYTHQHVGNEPQETASVKQK
ncbi:MAG: hypothetical protein HFG49_11885 [Lachnospiraceae bacterium]|jgi:hypothetical protein|nr:hypothetical protein [Lachnospiraceae bacterium]